MHILISTARCYYKIAPACRKNRYLIFTILHGNDIMNVNTPLTLILSVVC
jgi:hypothetical protein